MIASLLFAILFVLHCIYLAPALWRQGGSFAIETAVGLAIFLLFGAIYFLLDAGSRKK